jgi:pimeloyl-ACP methyl ester carboxylesterase
MSAGSPPSTNGETRGLRAHFIDVDGIRTRYYDEGQGEPVVLVAGHGWAGYFNANLWDTNIAGLSRRFRVLAPDKLGSGLTDNPPPEQYTIEAQVKHILRFIETLGLGGVHLAGQSRGGYLVARLAIERPDLLKTLTIIGTGTLAPEVGDSQGRRAALFSEAPADLKQQLRFRLERLSFSPAHITDELLDTDVYIESLPKSRAGKALWESGGEQLFDRTLGAQKPGTLAAIEDDGFRMPTLLYWGLNDPNALYAQGVQLFELVAKHTRHARMYSVNQAGHFPFREYPAEFNRVVGDFAAAS